MQSGLRLLFDSEEAAIVCGHDPTACQIVDVIMDEEDNTVFHFRNMTTKDGLFSSSLEDISALVQLADPEDLAIIETFRVVR
jgi:hypothetical protein